MVGDYDNNDDGPYYDAHDEFGHFTDEALRNFMSDVVPDFSDLPFTNNLLSLPPPPNTQAMEINEPLSSSFPEFNSNNDYLSLPLENDHTLPWNTFDIPSVDLNDITSVINALGEENGNGNNAGGTSLEVSTRVLGPNFETGGTSRTTTVPVMSPVPLQIGSREKTTKPKKARMGRQTRLAAQRERTANMTVKDLSIYFHAPMTVAAEKMDLCSTSVKKICRRGGFGRWPHRKISSIKNRITTLTKTLENANGADRARIQQQIELGQKEINDIYARALQNSLG